LWNLHEEFKFSFNDRLILDSCWYKKKFLVFVVNLVSFCVSLYVNEVDRFFAFVLLSSIAFFVLELLLFVNL